MTIARLVSAAGFFVLAASFGCGGTGSADDTDVVSEEVVSGDSAEGDLVPNPDSLDANLPDALTDAEGHQDARQDISADVEPDVAGDGLDAEDPGLDGSAGDAGDSGTGELPQAIAEIGRALDPAFLQPSLGFTFRIVTPLMAEYPAAGPNPSDLAWIIQSELVLPSGDVVRLEERGDTFAVLYPIDGYDDSWIFINGGGTDVVSGDIYTLNLYPMLSTMQWMKENGIDEISGEYAPFVVYRTGMFRGVWVSCPAMVGDSPSLSKMRVYFGPDTLQPGSPVGLMVNSYVTGDRSVISKSFGVSQYHQACTCYDVVGMTTKERPCTAGDIDQYPGQAAVEFPPDGAEAVAAVGTALQWGSSGDADGGTVSFDVWLGTDRMTLAKVAGPIQSVSYQPNLVPDTTYFWRVDVRDDEGNLVPGRVWTFNTDTVAPQLNDHNYLILVDRRLKGQLDDELATYVQDVVNQDDTLVPAVRYWMPGDHVMMRDIIIDSFMNRCVGEDDCLRGVFLVGDLPSAWYEQDSDYGGDIGIMHEEFPTELFFQDLDNQWRDDDGNGIFDGHSDFALEIFSARLVGGVERMKSYFARLHEYRQNGSFFNPRNFFSFIDDDWNGANSYGVPDGSTTNQEWGLESVYGDNYIRREWSDNTDKTDYLEVMSGGGAEFVYQWIHSDPQQIYFDDNFSPNPDNILSLQELVAADVSGSFFNLFDCSISRYTEPMGNIATEYVYSRYGLATVGSTKTGGIFNPDVLHGAMLAGHGTGQALRMWFDDTWANRDAYGLPDPTFDDWWLGMMIQGDPLVLLNPQAGSSLPRSVSATTGPKSERVFELREIDALYRIMGRRAATTVVNGHREYMRNR
ncbi:MAG TPA: hypothetical protein PLC24_03980 [Myxococcota bacterium]|nr:hypothetical protein [Myxococcota bacterium]